VIVNFESLQCYRNGRVHNFTLNPLTLYYSVRVVTTTESVEPSHAAPVDSNHAWVMERASDCETAAFSSRCRHVLVSFKIWLNNSNFENV